MQKKLETCPYVNRHKFCPKCGKDNPKVCGDDEETLYQEQLVDNLVDEPKETRVTPQAETLTFEKPKGRGRRG